MVVLGKISGSIHVARGSTLVVEPQGTLAGSLANHGTVIVRCVFGGSRSGNGELRLEGTGWVKQPVTKDGIQYYEW